MFEHTVSSDWFPRCAIFDCDGILLDSETVWNDVQRELFARWSVPFTEEVEHSLTGLAAADVAEELALLSYEAQNGQKPDTASAEYAEHHERVMKDLLTTEHEVISSGVDLIEGAQKFLGFLSEHMPVAVASNSTANILTLKMESYGYAPLVRTWVSSEDVPHGKPAPDMYIEAARRLGCDPVDALTVEDSAAGAQAARDAGTKVLIYVPDGDTASAPAGYGYFESFTDPALWDAARTWVAALEGARAAEGAHSPEDEPPLVEAHA